MVRRNALTTLLLVPLALACGGGQIGSIAGDDGDDGSGQLTAATSAPVIANGSRAQVTASALNLRSQPSTSATIILAMPHGATVDVLGTSGSWSSVRYQTHVGWAFSSYLSAISSSGTGGGPVTRGPPVSSGGTPSQQPQASADVAGAIARADSGLGFSYHWGAGCWSPGSNSPGACFGSCPNCTHNGSWGADCSGYVSKIWQVPSAEDVTTCSHPFSSSSFYDTHPYWQDVPRSSARQGDAFVRHGHIFLFDSGDAWGGINAYEAKGCSYGIVHDNRTADSSYKVIRRNGY
jgi:cell wall-associated NlpC family hydrolase